jgi:endonuclease/exonuclease/phosphatase family metal-dependent hydrolase
VYGPQLEGEKLQFMQELRDIRPMTYKRWVLLGDFNLIYKICDKSNGNVNRRLLNQFRQVLEELEVKELHLNGHRFTWTSKTRTSTQTKIDHVFVTKEWEMLYSNCHLQAGGSSISDHCPMILTCNPFHRAYKVFRFEFF